MDHNYMTPEERSPVVIIDGKSCMNIVDLADVARSHKAVDSVMDQLAAALTNALSELEPDTQDHRDALQALWRYRALTGQGGGILAFIS